MIDTHENNSVVVSFPDRELRVRGEITHVSYDSEGKPCGIDFLSKEISIGPRKEDWHEFQSRFDYILNG